MKWWPAFVCVHVCVWVLRNQQDKWYLHPMTYQITKHSVSCCWESSTHTHTIYYINIYMKCMAFLFLRENLWKIHFCINKLVHFIRYLFVSLPNNLKVCIDTHIPYTMFACFDKWRRALAHLIIFACVSTIVISFLDFKFLIFIVLSLMHVVVKIDSLFTLIGHFSCTMQSPLSLGLNWCARVVGRARTHGLHLSKKDTNSNPKQIALFYFRSNIKYAQNAQIQIYHQWWIVTPTIYIYFTTFFTFPITSMSQRERTGQALARIWLHKVINTSQNSLIRRKKSRKNVIHNNTLKTHKSGKYKACT